MSEEKMTAREAILAWAASPGFAEIHNGQATNEQITDHLLLTLAEAGFVIVPLDEFEDMEREIAYLDSISG